jgi:3-hydroxyisobutyrate dehydrogenase-like beta-hydroxyacid dehydrogenase
MTKSVGFIGLGNMGNPMALNLLKKGYAVTVFDMNPKAAANLIEAGAKGAASAAEAIANADVVFTSLPGTPEVEPFYLAPGGAVEKAKAGAVLIDLSSVLPSTPRIIEAAAKARGLKFLEAPVSGGVTGARAATLAVMTGGDASVLEQVLPLLEAIGKNIYHVGPAGAANTIKAINNMLSTVNACALMEGLVVGLKAGLDLKTMAEIIKNSSGNSNAIPRATLNPVSRSR